MNIVPFTSRDSLGRYYTESAISSLLVSLMDTADATNILDLGCGLGSLSFAASKRWNDAKIFSLDIENRHQFLSVENQNRHHVVGDALLFDLPNTLGVTEGSIDLAVCNPPYIKPDWRDEFQQVSEQIGICKYSSITKICSSEVLFLAQMIRMLKSGGEAGVILPDGIFTAEKFCNFREFLLKEHCVKKVIQLPRKIFRRTEAQTHILIFNKTAYERDSEAIELRTILKTGKLSPAISISAADGVHRLDYSYHSRSKKKIPLLGSELQTFAEIKRGKQSSIQVRKLEYATVHTTDLTGADPNYSLLGETDLLDLDSTKYLVARPGDILIARVGRNFFKKIAYIVSGYAVVSDCLFVIRTDKSSKKIFKHLSSKEGQSKISDLSYGVAAAQMSMKQLANLKMDFK
ncbi:N-6 DNA methylase [Pseudomonas viridiflava]|uniref:HsdM family class I SAM-dependent methyltransferase n=1 Tax=Pseudomonas viridiflava TaxID=33069 RepID=UPI002EC70C3D|nr:N-6 DNA methylase [Pseudomonas viridiflava]